MAASGSDLGTALVVVAIHAHAFSVVLLVDVRTLSDHLAVRLVNGFLQFGQNLYLLRF